MPAIVAILFDADGVIQHASEQGLAGQLERILGFIPHDVDAFARDVFEVERASLAGLANFAEAKHSTCTR